MKSLLTGFYLTLATGLFLGICQSTLAETVIVTQPTGNTPTTMTKEVIVTTPPTKAFFICYKHLTKYISRNIDVERCNPNGMCQNMVIPRKVKVISYQNCQLNSTGCYGAVPSQYGKYPTPQQAAQALKACQSHPIVIERQ